MVKHKKGICMADGGITQETPDQLMARMTAKYGAPSAGPTQQAAPQPVQPAAQPVQPAPKRGIADGIRSMFGNRQKQLDEQERKAMGYANGGIAGHVKFEGKGGPREDKIPVKVAGQDINVSNGEQALIIPAKTAADAQAMEAIKQIIADSNDGRQPDMGGGDANFAEGGLLDDEARRMNYQAVTGVQAPAPTPAPAVQPESGGWGFGKSGPGATLQVTTGDAARLPAPVVQQGIATMRSQLAPAKPNFADNSQAGLDNRLAAMQAANGGASAATAAMNNDQQNAALSKAVTPTNTASGPTVSDGAGGVYTPESGSRPGAGIAELPGAVANFFRDSAQAARGDKPYEQIRAERAAGQGVANGQPGSGASVNAGGALQVDPYGAQPNKLSVPASTDSAFMTGKAGALPDSSGGGFTQGNTSYNVNPSSQDGITKVTASGKNPLYTNIRPEEAVSGLKNQMIGGDAASVQEGLDRHARANAITQSRIDQQAPGGIAILNDPNEADNAEKSARWRQDDLIAKSARNQAAGQVAAISAQGQNQREQEDARASIESGRNAVVMRGQDIAASRGAADEQLKQAQAKGIAATTESTQMLADIQKKALAGDPQALATYRALTGKAGSASDRYVTVQGGEEIAADGITKIKKPSGVFDGQTGRFVPMGGQQNGQSFGKADVEAAIKGGADKAKIAERIKSMGGNPADYGL